MDKGFGFSRTITLDWLDLTASLCLQGVEPAVIRQQLAGSISDTVYGLEAQRKTIDVLMAIWIKSKDSVPVLHKQALSIFPTLTTANERLWAHYGLALAYYPVFRKCVNVIGQISRTEESITRNVVKDKIAADFGHFGALNRAVERILASLKNWGVLIGTSEKSIYKILRKTFDTQNPELETWLLACSLSAHPSDGLPINDLVQLPELFPFQIRIGVDVLQKSAIFEVHRQGGGLDNIFLKIS